MTTEAEAPSCNAYRGNAHCIRDARCYWSYSGRGCVALTPPPTTATPAAKGRASLTAMDGTAANGAGSVASLLAAPAALLLVVMC
jgi:hypothetical protein